MEILDRLEREVEELKGRVSTLEQREPQEAVLEEVEAGELYWDWFNDRRKRARGGVP